MGPGGSFSPFNEYISNKAPSFKITVTPKNSYRYALRRWIKLMSKLYTGDKKYKDVLDVVSHLILMNCDPIEQDLLQMAKNAGKLNLHGSDEYPRRIKMVGKVSSIIYKDYPTKKINHKVDNLI